MYYCCLVVSLNLFFIYPALVLLHMNSIKISISYRYRPSIDLFPIVVSQDCEHEGTSNIIDSYGDAITHIQVSFSYGVWLSQRAESRDMEASYSET